jgi:hypothetical protein
MPGEKCRLGAGCVNGARLVLSGLSTSIGQGSNIVTPQRETGGKPRTQSVSRIREKLFYSLGAAVVSFLARSLSTAAARSTQPFVH